MLLHFSIFFLLYTKPSLSYRRTLDPVPAMKMLAASILYGIQYRTDYPFVYIFGPVLVLFVLILEK